MVKNTTAGAGDIDIGLIPGLGISLEKWQPQYSCLGKSWAEEPGRL